MRIVDLKNNQTDRIRQIALLLKESFHGQCPDYECLEDAEKKVISSFDDHEISRVALDDDDSVLGWVAGIRQYSGHVYELDPLVVKKNTQGRGIGKALVEDFERLVAQRGAQTIWLGTDDENDSTNLSACNLYPDVLNKARNIALRDGCAHPFRFYQKLGFVVVGVLPDANGEGKPDIYMAKKVKRF